MCNQNSTVHEVLKDDAAASVTSTESGAVSTPATSVSECIKVQKVYDWIIKKMEQNVTVRVPDDLMPAINEAIASQHTLRISGVLPVTAVESEVVYIQYGVEVIVNGVKIKVSCVQILKTMTATITVYDETAAVVIGQFDATQQFLERVALCVPEGMDENNIFIKVLDTNFVVLTSRAPINGMLTVQYDTCQNIQVEAEVKLQVLGSFCHPRKDNISCDPGGSITCNEVPPLAQCPAIFPG